MLSTQIETINNLVDYIVNRSSEDSSEVKSYSKLYEIVKAANGEEFIEYFRKHKPTIELFGIEIILYPERNQFRKIRYLDKLVCFIDN